MDVQSNAVLDTLLFFHYKFSTSQRITYLILFSFITAFFLLVLRIRNKTSFKYVSGLSSAVVICLSLSLLFEYYHPERKGVLIQPEYARVDAGNAFSPIIPVPVGEGSIVTVLNIEKDWYKVEIAGHKKGYVPREALKLII